MAEYRQSAVSVLEESGAQTILEIVGQLRHALPDSKHRVHVVDVAEVFGVLGRHNDSDLLGVRQAIQIRGIIDTSEVVAVRRDEAVPLGAELERALEGVRPPPVRNHVDPGFFERPEVFSREACGVAKRRFELPEVPDLLRELRTIVAEARPTDTVFRTNHASSYLPMAGRLPRDRDTILTAIDAALEGHIPLRPEFMRGL